MNNIKMYFEKLKRVKRLKDVTRVEHEAIQLFNIISIDGKPVLTFRGVIITTPEECPTQVLLDKMFKLREFYVRNKKDIIESSLW